MSGSLSIDPTDGQTFDITYFRGQCNKRQWHLVRLFVADASPLRAHSRTNLDRNMSKCSQMVQILKIRVSEAPRVCV